MKLNRRQGVRRVLYTFHTLDGGPGPWVYCACVDVTGGDIKLIYYWNESNESNDCHLHVFMYITKHGQ